MKTKATFTATDALGRPARSINWELLLSRSYEDRLLYGDRPLPDRPLPEVEVSQDQAKEQN